VYLTLPAANVWCRFLFLFPDNWNIYEAHKICVSALRYKK